MIAMIKPHTVDSDSNNVTDFFDLATSQADGTKIPENQMIISSLCLKLVSACNKFFRKGTRIGDDLPRVLFE